MAMQLTVVGCGDAFGSGGRLQSAYLIDTAQGAVLLDAGATVTTGLNRLGRAPNDIPTVVISHLHGDHFAGLIWLFVQAMYVTKRTAPLAIFGPPGIEARFFATAELLFPRCTQVPRKFAISFTEMHAGQPIQTGPLQATAFEVAHPSGAPSHALRLVHGGKVLAFTGDSQWTESLVPCGAGADLYLMECYQYATAAGPHLSWAVIAPHLDRIGARRVLLTHMAEAMLARQADVSDPRVLFATDGLVVDV
jgi:ribonuclease BN (tRNA processing enzyme)